MNHMTKILSYNDNIQLSYVYIYVSAKSLPFTHFYIIRHDMQLFVTPFPLKSAKLTKKRLKVIEYAARGYGCIISVI